MEEVFKDLSAHMIKGLMIYDKLSSYYCFLGFKGFKRLCEYYYYKQNIKYRKLQKYYTEVHSKLIPEEKIEDPAIIPESWYKYKREDVDTNTKRSSLETGLKAWVGWCKDTKKLFEENIKTLIDNGHIADADFINMYLKDTAKELKLAERMLLDYSCTNYDPIFIIEEQQAMHDKYKAMLKDLKA